MTIVAAIDTSLAQIIDGLFNDSQLRTSRSAGALETALRLPALLVCTFLEAGETQAQSSVLTPAVETKMKAQIGLLYALPSFC